MGRGWLRDRLLGRRSLEGGSWVGWHVWRVLYGGIKKGVRVCSGSIGMHCGIHSCNSVSLIVPKPRQEILSYFPQISRLAYDLLWRLHQRNCEYTDSINWVAVSQCHPLRWVVKYSLNVSYNTDKTRLLFLTITKISLNMVLDIRLVSDMCSCYM